MATYGSLSGAFGTVPTVRKPKPEPTQVDTNGRPTTGASFTPNTPQGGGGGVSSTGVPGQGHTFTGTIGTNPGQKAATTPTTALGTTPAARGSNPGGVASGIAPPPPPSGAPDPGTPNTGAIPPIQSDEDQITDANTDYGTTYGGLYQGIQGAALAYGDPTILSQYGEGTTDPNGALAQAATKALLANQANDATQTNNGTFFSSVNQTARGNIQNQQQTDISAANTAWQQALGTFNTAVTTAQNARDRIIRGAREDEGTQAIKNLPTTAAPVPAGPAASTGGGGQQAGAPTAGSGFSGLAAAPAPRGFSGYAAPAPKPLINVPKVKSGFGYHGGF